MQIKNLGQENGFWFQINLETNPPILFVSDLKTQKQKIIIGAPNKDQRFCFDLKKFITGVVIEINKWYSIFWYKNGKTHREDGPAIIRVNGHKEWHKNGLCHREDGPAITHSNGDKGWFRNGQLHREDGPAVVWSNGHKEWWLDGKKYSEQGWRNFVKIKK